MKPAAESGAMQERQDHREPPQARRGKEGTHHPTGGAQCVQGPRRRGKSASREAPHLEASLLVCRDHTEYPHPTSLPLGMELSLPWPPLSPISTHFWLPTGWGRTCGVS